MLNITAHGNLGKDPEIKYFEGNRQVTKFSLAARTGKNETTWLDCLVWGKQGQAAADYLRKGSKITIAGKARINKYETAKGGKGQSLEVTVTDFTLPPKADKNEIPF
tara:strand:- start:245 stop:565 length:321 start_codon:yes stop_codon:yes gene_type:complete